MIGETIDYDETYNYIVAHEKKYTPLEFNNICDKIMDKHGKIREKSSCHDRLGAYWYHISAETLIHYLISDYGFIELDLGYFDCTQARRIQGPERDYSYIRYNVDSPKCPEQILKEKMDDWERVLPK